MRRYYFALLLLSTLLVQGCSTTPKKAASDNEAVYQQHIQQLSTIKDFDLAGKLGVIYQKKGFSGGINWAHKINYDMIEVLSPLGSKVAVIEKKPDIVTLTDSKKQVKIAPDVETLTATYLGWQLPLSGLSDWALGKPTDKAPIDDVSWDAFGRLQTLSQQGWAIEYLNYVEHNGLSLPSKIRIKNDHVRLKLIVKNWHTPNDTIQ